MSRASIDEFRPAPWHNVHAHAVALSGRIWAHRSPDKPPGSKRALVDADISIVGGSCALPVSGGRSVSRSERQPTYVQGDRVVYVAETEAETWDKYDRRTHVRYTFARTVVRGLEVGAGKVRLRLDRAELLLQGRYDPKDDRARFLLREARMSGLVVGDQELDVQFRAGELAFDPRAKTRLVAPRCKVAGASPKARLKAHAAGYYFDDFGAVYLGEAEVGPRSARVSLLRFVLGCPTTGHGSCGEGYVNGDPDPDRT